MRKVGTWITAALCTTALVVACGDSPFTPEGVAGVYALVSADGQPLPAQGVSTGSLSLQANGTYSISLTEEGAQPITGVGTYTLVGSHMIQFLSLRNLGTARCCDISGDFTGIRDGNEITLGEGGVVLVFRK